MSKPRPRRRDPEAKMQQISFLWNICFHSWSPKYLKFEIFVFTYDHRTGNVTCPFFFDIGRLKSSCPVACSQCSKSVWFKIPLMEMNFFRLFWDQAISKIYMQRVWVLNLSLKFELLFESFSHIPKYIKPQKRQLSKTMTKERNYS